LALGRLSAREQSVLSLRFMEGLSYEEIADVLGARPATLRVVANRAITRLRRGLSRRPGSRASQNEEKPAL